MKRRGSEQQIAADVWPVSYSISQDARCNETQRLGVCLYDAGGTVSRRSVGGPSAAGPEVAIMGGERGGYGRRQLGKHQIPCGRTILSNMCPGGIEKVVEFHGHDRYELRFAKYAPTS